MSFNVNRKWNRVSLVWEILTAYPQLATDAAEKTPLRTNGSWLIAEDEFEIQTKQLQYATEDARILNLVLNTRTRTQRMYL